MEPEESGRESFEEKVTTALQRLCEEIDTWWLYLEIWRLIVLLVRTLWCCSHADEVCQRSLGREGSGERWIRCMETTPNLLKTMKKKYWLGPGDACEVNRVCFKGRWYWNVFVGYELDIKKKRKMKMQEGSVGSHTVESHKGCRGEIWKTKQKSCQSHTQGRLFLNCLRTQSGLQGF